MTDDHRPDPDALLAAIQDQEARQGRGKLKIFFGMAAGVGKTYAMLDAAHARIGEGIDVVIGYVETHKRAETEALLDRLEIIPRQKVEYRGTTLEEMDLDAILLRKPALVLVDELAHTNVPGVRHPKRYQDVIEILEAGINVYTTVNVQHFESRADTVRQITGITVHETVPDSIIDLADEIELIDLSPEDLRKRLAEGKVYVPEKVETAANNFFRVGNLTALREMALRLTAERVDHQLQNYMQIKRIAGPWKSSERLLVAVGPSPFSEQLIRWTRRMAYNLEADWLAVYVETSQTLTPEQRDTLTKNLELARDLGAEVVTAAGDDIPATLINTARQRNVSQIVMGKPVHSRLHDLLRGGSPVDQVVRASGNIDVFVVTGNPTPTTTPLFNLDTRQTSNLQQYGIALLTIVSITLIELLVIDVANYQLFGLIDLFAVMLIAIYVGRGPAVMAAAFSALTWNFLFIEPRFTFQISQVQDVLLLLMYFAIAVFTGNLTARIRTQERQARRNAERTMALYSLTHEIASAVDMDAVLHSAAAQIGRVFNSDVSILLMKDGGLSTEAHSCSTFTLDERELGAAQWAFENEHSAGRHTDTLPSAAGRYIPLRTPTGSVGILGLRLRDDQRLSFDQEALLETFSNQVALAIEREILDQAAEQAAMLRESERLYTALLNSISHELRTPIATISGAASGLLDPTTSGDGANRAELTQDIQTAAERLNRLVENLLDMSRLESGRLTLKREWCDICELIGVAVQRMGSALGERRLIIDCPPALPLVQMDFVLMEQVIINLLDNVAHYTPPTTSVQIEAAAQPQHLLIRVSDDGPGIPHDKLEQIFDKFYRVPGTPTGGTGLGLSISRGLVEAHGGTLTAENRATGGAVFTLRLPRGAAPPPAKEAAL
ncbi:MAG: sensor histidine kinase KdpD [Chloroflexota bacterium]|nr:sensor histidine kinase KdpD [Chloroflexota bacterium]